MKLTYVFLLFLIFSFETHAQHHEEDTSKTFTNFIKKGHLKLHARTYFMSTHNQSKAYNYGSLAQGVELHYTTPKFHGFQFETSGFITVRFAEYNLIDDENHGWNGVRYEKYLSDIEHPTENHVTQMFDEIALFYHHNNWAFKLGNQTFESPLLNENYNRLRPNIFNGLSNSYKKNKLEMRSALFFAETVRGTSHSKSIQNTFGVYGVGLNQYGDESSYSHNISSLGLGVIGLKYQSGEWSNQLWNYTAENVFNLTFIQSDFKLPFNSQKLLLGIQAFHETSLNNGGNKNSEHAYIRPGEYTFGIGGQLGINLKEQHEFTLNYLGISKQGRYLFPREWGREQFYASQTAELFEGYGGLNALVVRYEYHSKNKFHSAILSGGIIDQPDLDNYELNKYQLADYSHFLVEYKYDFHKYLTGLYLRVITIYKHDNSNELELSDHQLANRSNMLNINLILDYHL
ncbi:OprD family outer membrane porin [Brumimicrobium aurantiacum]|uniref:Outer membrane porin, OprD family n=1 Tax=Brumimicrobium aurantiacum TaxID=1737063 RepID=A0A3E1EYE3_9FLAO|nr:OprD family outer membrane porin [Brumimicrobium aurantiacum]RFC54569.1 outer membrane porin, OprD family [Brumimicrobium aurantiacum]